MKLSIWSSEQMMTLKEFDIEFPIYVQTMEISEVSCTEIFIKYNYLEPAGRGIRLERIRIVKREEFGSEEIEWSIDSEVLIWFDKMSINDSPEYMFGLRGYKLPESKWKEVVIELKEFIRDIV